MAINKLFSVVICTHNRADLARDAIASVLAQEFPQTEYELLIVDNASTDKTREVAQVFCDAYPDVRYFFESKVGLSHARNRGWQEAGGEYVAYIDDDCKVPSTWLKSASSVIQQEHPAALGGPFYPFYNVSKPVWFKDAYGSHVQGQVARQLQAGEYLAGGNMFLRLDILKSLGGFDAEFGMKGRNIGYGEETKFFILLHREKDGLIYYSPDVFVYHLVNPSKFGLWTNVRMNFYGGYYFTKISNQFKRGNFLDSTLRMFKIVLSIFKSLSWDLLLRDRLLYPYFQNFLYEVTFQFIIELGFIIGKFGVSDGS